MAIPQPIPCFPAAVRFADGSDTPRDLLERCLAQLKEFEPTVGAFVCHDIPAAQEAADLAASRWRSACPLSPIDGMPVGIKDIIETVDMPTGQGSPLWDGTRTGRDSASVAALREAGAIILGKTVTTEFASSEPLGNTSNPWDPARTPGGSSSGSAAAVGCGMVPAALGTQVVGSIIRPASFCGCVGYKPSVGGLNRGGSYDYFSQSCTGLLAASLEDAWLVATAISSRVGGDAGYVGVQGPSEPPPATKPQRLAMLETAGWEVAVPEAKAALETAIARLVEAGVAIARRSDDPAIAAIETAIADAEALTRQINAWEGRWPLNTYREIDAGKLSAAALDRLKQAESLSQADYATAFTRRRDNRAQFAALAQSYDAIVTLPATGPAPIGLAYTGNPVFAVPFSMLGVPTVSLPLFLVEGLPLGLQIVGFEGGDARLFAIAAGVRDLLQPGGR
jgi:Asp-tRNA(Asn)/Glu-tRNA(Gln) amidotransferase A subunit family amidase